MLLRQEDTTIPSLEKDECMYGQPWGQGSNASTGSRTVPAFFQSPSLAPVRNGSGDKQKNKPLPYRLGMEPEIPKVEDMLLAVYETADEYRAGILLVESVVQIEASEPGTCASHAGGESRTGSWLGRVAELHLETEHQPGQRLQWAEAIELSSEKLLYAEVLVCKLKSEHVAACRSLVSRLRSIARMLEMSRCRGRELYGR